MNEVATVLLIEDNVGDAHLFEFMLKKVSTPYQLVYAEDGALAMQILQQEGIYQNTKLPDFIILDLNLPKIDGRQILKEIKASEKLRQIPVMILSSSTADEDILNSYDNYANCYFVKPMSLEGLFTLIKKIDDFWLGYVRLPFHLSQVSKTGAGINGVEDNRKIS